MPCSKIKLWARTRGTEYRKMPHGDQRALTEGVDPVLVPQQT